MVSLRFNQELCFRFALAKITAPILRMAPVPTPSRRVLPSLRSAKNGSLRSTRGGSLRSAKCAFTSFIASIMQIKIKRSAYAQQQAGNLAGAQVNLNRALRINPRHRGAIVLAEGIGRQWPTPESRENAVRFATTDSANRNRYYANRMK